MIHILRRTRKHAREGFTLIEMLIVMTAGTALLLAGIKVIEQTMKFSQLNTSRNHDQLVLARFSDQLRRDAHAAFHASIEKVESSSETRLKLAMPDQSEIVYIFTLGRAQRESVSTCTATQRAREVFQLASDYRFDPQTDELSENISLIDLKVWRLTDGDERLEAHVSAVVNRSQILSQQKFESAAHE